MGKIEVMIKKADALSKLAEDEEAERELWEKKIDAALSKHVDRTWIDSRGITRRVRDRLIADYQKKGGWVVEHVDDQRDGPSLVFS